MRLEKILSLSYLVPMDNPLNPECIWGLASVLHGKPGIGKTARVKTSGKLLHLPVGIVELGGKQPEDAAGAPFLTKNDELVIACLLQPVNELNAKGRGVLFLDEFNWARPATQGAFLSMVWGRRVGDTVFSNHIRIVLAGNPPSSAGGGYMLIPPMANRLAHWDIPAPSDEEEDDYLMGMLQEDPLLIEQGEQKIQASWSNEWPKTVGAMMGFKRKFPQHRLAEPKTGDPKAHKAWPSPRSREMAMRAVTTVRIMEGKDSEDIQDEFFTACCGEAAAVDWAAYRADADLPDPEDMLKNGYKPDRTRLDKTLASVGCAASFVIGRTTLDERKQYAEPMWGIIENLLDSGLGDIGAPIAQGLVRNKLGSQVGGACAVLVKKLMLRMGKAGIHHYVGDSTP